MLQLAENVKIQLSEQRTAKVPVTVRAQGILVDSEGRSVQFLDKMTREQYAGLIQEHLDKTIECCRRALAKAELEASQLDAILLVGGSTHGQWVAEALRQAFDVELVHHDPDLCVAAGAALRAADLPPVASTRDLHLVIDVPTASSLPMINVTGEVQGPDGRALDAALRDELTVMLHTPRGQIFGPAPLAGDRGGFFFPDLDLAEDDPNEFYLQIVDSKGLERLGKSFGIRYSLDGPSGGSISTSLPKPLYLKTAPGMRLVAEEGRPLPAKCELSMQLLHNDGDLDIDIYQEETEIGKVHIENVPPDVRVGSPVIVTVEITDKNEIRGTAKVLQRAGGAVVAECQVFVRFPPLQIPELPELRGKLRCARGSARRARRTLQRPRAAPVAGRAGRPHGAQHSPPVR